LGFDQCLPAIFIYLPSLRKTRQVGILFDFCLPAICNILKIFVKNRRAGDFGFWDLKNQ